jgi:uncharacterized protein YccT (UPF0319 family)
MVALPEFTLIDLCVNAYGPKSNPFVIVKSPPAVISFNTKLDAAKFAPPIRTIPDGVATVAVRGVPAVADNENTGEITRICPAPAPKAR